MQKKERTKRIKKREPNRDLKIYDLTGKLIYIGREGFSVDFQELIGAKRQKKQKSLYNDSKRAS